MRRRSPVLVVTACVLGLVGCAGTDDGGGAATGAGRPRDPAVELPRSVNYAGFRWTVDAATLDSAGRDPSGDSEGPTARLDFTVVSSLDTVEVTYRAEHLALRYPDGTLVRATRFHLGAKGARDRLAVGPGERSTGSAVFRVNERTDLSVLAFTIDVRSATPAVLPLSGEIPPDPYPIAGSVSGRSGAIADWESTEPEVEVEAVAARAALDYAQLRAPRGEMLLVIRIRISGVEGRRHEGRVDDDFFRLIVGDLRLSPAYKARAAAAPGASTELDVVFSVPLGSTSMTLTAGQRGTEAARFPVSLPPAR